MTYPNNMKKIQQMVEELLKEYEHTPIEDRGDLIKRYQESISSYGVDVYNAIENKKREELTSKLDSYSSCVVLVNLELLYQYSHKDYKGDIIVFEGALTDLIDVLKEKTDRFFKWDIEVCDMSINTKRALNLPFEFKKILDQVKKTIKQKDRKMIKIGEMLYNITGEDTSGLTETELRDRTKRDVTTMNIFKRDIIKEKYSTENMLDSYYNCVCLIHIRRLELYARFYFPLHPKYFETAVEEIRRSLVDHNNVFYARCKYKNGNNFNRAITLQSRFYDLLRAIENKNKQEGGTMPSKDKIVGKLNEVIEDIKDLRDKSAVKNREQVIECLKNLDKETIMCIYNEHHDILELVKQEDESFKDLFDSSLIDLVYTNRVVQKNLYKLYLIKAKFKAMSTKCKSGDFDYMPLHEINTLMYTHCHSNK